MADGVFGLVVLRVSFVHNPGLERWRQFLKWVTPEPCAGEGRGRPSRHYGWVIIIFPTTAEREDTPVLIIISRRKAFTVLGLTFIRFAISLLLRPCSKYVNASPSRCVKLNCWKTCDMGINPDGPRSSRTAMLGCEGSLLWASTRKARQK